MRWNQIEKFICRAVLFIGCSSMVMSAGNARANPMIAIFTVSPPIAAAISSANRHCISITYDKNGNRLAQAEASVTATPTTWGSGTYGCFTWSE
ncbi:hypothetical protein MNBD_ALPHA04-539 [hydrothermal vent metagenome]|uniref:Uncharacterized protein n=1 Tax=hydrothermal vent metagenome TaxID=652676 RepID=A0A3B0RW09_9ZZZZ